MRGPSFVAIIRTTGKESHLLEESLESLTFQAQACRAVVVVHAELDYFQAVERQCRSVRGLDIVVLHAENTRKKRGYPINVGLEYCYQNVADVQYVFFLDDNDIVYPFFTQAILATFTTTEADVVYAASNQREEGSPAKTGYSAKPILNLLRENFIPSNSFAIRLDALRKLKLRMDEGMDYTEDWLFLIVLLQNGLFFEANCATLSEFRISSHRNREVERHSLDWKSAASEIRRKIGNSKFLISGAMLIKAVADDNVRSRRPAEAVPSVRSLRRDTTVEKDKQIDALRRRIFDLEHSLSWRLSFPLRLVGSAVLKLRSRVSRGL
jgi:hypothetical protein